jgi:phosphatidylglycerophosphatase A
MILAVIVLGTWGADRYAKMKNVLDPGEVVIDEVAGMWLSLWGLPNAYIPGAFLLFRIVDILKPFPVCTMEKLPGGWGIMADDIVGGAMANLILQGFYWIFKAS